MDAPFVLLDDARTGRACLYTGLRAVVRADRAADVPAALDRLRRTARAAGFLSYEAGGAFDPDPPAEVASPALPHLWFGLFECSEPVDPERFLPDPASAWAGTPRPAIHRETHLARVAEVLEAIRAGDIYQANLTFPADLPVLGSPPALYAQLRRRQRMGHGALVWTGEHWLLSFSPELFFETDGRKIRARPMKGTAAPDAAPESLSSDPKQRAENLMIVDLIRNDLSRVAVPGSVVVPRLFAVERYPTVLQMVSEVEAELLPGRDAVDILAAAFPCGSITGAPKLKAMEVLRRIECEPRGVYTGSIGALDGGRAHFNVAIRTLHIPAGAARARIGLGSGIVADSDPADEWEECLTKGRFVSSPSRFDLIETVGLDAMDGLVRLERHLERMRRSADAFGFPFNRHDVRNELQAATFRLRENSVVRLLCSPAGATVIFTAPCPARPDGPVDVGLASLPVAASDFRLRHKTTDRRFYDDARAASGCFEVLFEDPAGFITEGSFTNVFVERGGRLLTPPLSRGLLPGVLRAELIDEGRAVEAELTVADLAGGFFVGNSLRGLLPARLASL